MLKLLHCHACRNAVCNAERNAAYTHAAVGPNTAATRAIECVLAMLSAREYHLGQVCLK